MWIDEIELESSHWIAKNKGADDIISKMNEQFKSTKNDILPRTPTFFIIFPKCSDCYHI